MTISRMLRSLISRARRVLFLIQKVIIRIIRTCVIRTFVLPIKLSPQFEQCKLKTSERKLPCFLLLRYKYSHGDKRCGISNEEQIRASSLRSNGIGEIVEYYYDVDYSGCIRGHRNLVKLVTSVCPDFIILSSYHYLIAEQPHFEVLKEIRLKYEIPFICLWFDGVSERAIKASSYMSDTIDLNILIDSNTLVNYFSKKDNYLMMWMPIDPNIYYPGEACRDIPISFLGSVGSYRAIRKEYLIYLGENRVEVYHTGGQKEQRVSIERYAGALRRSKISLNFSHSIPGKHQLKGRVFEILLSGALLMESENDMTPQYFTPMVDYVTFDSKEDLLDKVRYYLEHDEEREQIAYSGYKKAIKNYSGEAFWDKVLNKMAELNLFHGFHNDSSGVYTNLKGVRTGL
jgi:hypothetical protein